jgi:hypothetical protein
MGIAYRSILSFDPGINDRAELAGQVRKWLNGKGWSIPDEIGEIRSQDSDASLSYSQITQPFIAERWILSEVWAPNRALEIVQPSITSITLMEQPGKNWLWVEIETPEKKWTSNRTGRVVSEPIPASIPAIIRSVLEETSPSDGEFPISTKPVVLDQNLFAAFMHALRDEKRYGAFFVSSPPAGVTLERWLAKISLLNGGTIGMGNWVIIPRASLNVFNSMVGFGLNLLPGSIRTYLPGVEFSDPADTNRHKRLTFRTMSTMTESRVASFLRFSQISRLRSLHIPSFMLEAERYLLRALRFGGDSQGTRPNSSRNEDDATDYRVIAELYEREASQFRSERDDAEFNAELLRGELSELEDENNRLANREAYFRQKLVDLGEFQAAYSQPEIEDKPDSFEELLSAIDKLPSVLFCGDAEETIRLDSIETSSVALLRAWNAVRTFSAYAALKGQGRFRGSIDEYIRNTSHGGYSYISRVKPESESVLDNPRFRATREIEIPTPAGGSRRVICQNHVTLAKTGLYPTLYFYDDTALSGNVFIGHLGAHLENTLTN